MGGPCWCCCGGLAVVGKCGVAGRNRLAVLETVVAEEPGQTAVLWRLWSRGVSPALERGRGRQQPLGRAEGGAGACGTGGRRPAALSQGRGQGQDAGDGGQQPLGRCAPTVAELEPG